MKVEICENYEQMSRKTADFIAEYVRRKPDAILSFPAGDTPLGTFRRLVEAARQGTVDFSRCRFVGLDEWAGMDEKDEGSCKHFMYEELFNPLNIDPANICFFDAKANDLEAECKRVDAYIADHGPIGLMLVGLGVNGHIGLNEPGVSFDLYSHTAELDPVTKEVAQKYFKTETALTKGITLGLKHLMDAEAAVLIASGSRKADAVQRALQGPVTNELPASILQQHKNCIAIIDKEAAVKLGH